MFLTFLYIFIGINVCIYFIFLIVFYRGSSRKLSLANFEKKKVSVIIAARNEEKNLSGLLTGLVNQSYPQELIEIIVADDGSEDNTAGVVTEFSRKWSNIRLLPVQNRSVSVSFKKNALGQAIDASSGEIIITTDADCTVGKYWIQSFVYLFDTDIAMVAGFSRTNIEFSPATSLVQKYEHFDFNAMFLTAAAAINSGLYFSCSGQNLAYTREAFRKVGGFSSILHIESGDDVNLMQLFRKKHFKIIFNSNSKNFIKTRPVCSWKDLLNQRSRWASNMKWQLILNPVFFIYLISVFVTTLIPFVLIFLYPFYAIIILVLKLIMEYNFLKKNYIKFILEKKVLSFYPLWFILQPVYILSVSMMGLFDVYKWKK